MRNHVKALETLKTYRARLATSFEASINAHEVAQGLSEADLDRKADQADAELLIQLLDLMEELRESF